MKRYIYSILVFLIISISFLGFSFFSLGKPYFLYKQLYEYEKFTLSKANSDLTLFFLGSQKESYVDTLWIQLIQFLGQNFSNKNFVQEVHNFLEHITKIFPQFSPAYQFHLLVTPILRENASSLEKKVVQKSVQYGKKGMELLCDNEKLQKIKDEQFSPDLWKKESLKNPCPTWLISYYIWMHTLLSLSDWKDAHIYYKIASLHDDAPEASKYLSLLALTYSWKPFESAISSFLVSASWYDPAPFICQSAVLDILKSVRRVEDVNTDFIVRLSSLEKNMADTAISSIPESQTATNCVNSFRRWVKAIYIAYVSEKAKNSPEIQDASILVQKKIIPFVPTIKGQEWYHLLKKWGFWNFYR